LSFERIYEEVWKEKPNGSATEAIKSTVKRIRKKLALDSDDNSLIENIRGYGYKIPIYPKNMI